MEYRILGSLEVRSGDRTIPLGGVKQRALLAALLVHPNQVVSVDTLTEHLWGDAPPARAHNNLQVYVSRLRRAFEGSAGDSPLLTRPPGYLLRVDDEQLDGRRFERLQARGKALLLAGDAAGALDVLDEALSLWRGPALADFAFESFARSEITRLDELRLSALEDRVDAQLALGHEAEVVGELEALTAEHPLRERLRGQLMHALYRCGRQAEALATYREARRALADELGLEPGPDLRELEERILRQDPALRTPAAAGSLEEPSASAPHDIPRYLTRFIGRARELHEVKSRLRDARLLTLTGVAGSGKTRLAFEVASELLDSYPSGVRVVALDSLGDPGLVQHAVATAVGVRPQGGSALIEVLVHALESQRTLLVLDNCEHLLQACAELVRTLLTRCPDLQVLATSRERLSVAGELVWQVPPMPVPQSVGLPLESLEHHEAIELFIDRATAAWPHFGLTARNVPVVTQICTRLDGLPLALELAAAQVGSLGLDDIAARLQDRFLMLNLGDRTAPPRQQTLERAIDWSYELLDPKEKVLFASLSVFAGEFDLDAAEKVCPSSDVEAEELAHLLTRLVDKSLVARVPTDHGRARYRLLESLRQFGRERLRAAGLEDDLRRRHADHYVALAARAETSIRGPDQGLWLDRLEADLDNLRSALEWGRDRGGMGLALATSMWWFWESRGYPSEGLEWLSEGLDSDSGDDPAVRAKAQAVAASVALAMGDLDTGTRLARASHEAYARLDDPAGLSVATHILGTAARYASDYAEATRLLEEARRIAEEVGSTWDVAWALHHLGQVAGLVGDYESAQRHHVRSLALYREAGDELGAGFSLWMLGVVARYRGDYALAQARCEEALQLLHKLRDRSGEAHARYTMGDVARLQGAYERAGALYRDSLEQLRRVGDKRCVASVLSNLALVSIEKEQLDQADRFLAESVELRREAGDRAGLAECLERAAEVSHARGEHARAASLAAAAEAARATTASALPNPEKKRHERLVGSLRVSLDPSSFSAAWERGASAGLERALELAAAGGRLGAEGVPVRQ